MNGIINLYKPEGITSFQAVARLRKILKIKKIGHIGTLDPMAEGVLPMCIGQATRFVDHLMKGDKEYVARFRLGAATDTYDTTGTPTFENTDITPEHPDVESVLNGFVGETELPIPVYSSVKINGERAHKLAREGKEVDTGSRIMRIDEIQLTEYAYPEGVFRVRCGKGTYIRSIIHVLGEALGCGAAMSGLVRTMNGRFAAPEAVSLDDVAAHAEAGTLSEIMFAPWDVLDWPRARLKEDAEKLVANGVSPMRFHYSDLPDAGSAEFVFIQGNNGDVLAFASPRGADDPPFKLVRVFNSGESA